MSDIRYDIVDVFAQSQYTGNQLAVVQPEGELSGEEMQRIANEFDYSETTFIDPDGSHADGFEVRIFSPTTELPFAGHPTLGTAYVLRERLGLSDDELVLHEQVGAIPVSVEKTATGDEILLMEHPEPTFDEIIEPARAADAVSLPADVLDDQFPAQIISTGVPTLIVPVESLSAVKEAETNDEVYSELVDQYGVRNLLVFAPETYEPENELNVRVFAEFFGIPEDPATGASNGCLAAYLTEHQYFDTSEIDVRVEQGYEVNRPSLLYLRGQTTADSIRVEVGGRVIPTATGTLVESNSL
ncbi:PhzF family phenazine biosynthesis protein [Halobacterium sp. KA-4]|jgi:trans-2,3-dihydro-3-hydroxyanthranilate isomerase|uniref:PhzF family phenazine biosynthesis protein n=1 Tax=Halobacterium sp. KA-4 TaxID=2896367 RepID=UPI001E3AC276|nr:PhzF family phenazine biosynthesis protein [Halobacterium sp. KA-4]MCD2200915.1 PhzF family phenazine biosynthesis protein [Halobacterium sp. KA-4]